MNGRNDLPLTSLALWHAECVGQRIAASWQPSAVYASPMGRAIHTAEAIAHPLELAIRGEDDFIEIDYGQWTGFSHVDVISSWPAEAKLWFRAPNVAHIPGGETLMDVFGRVSRGTRNLVRRHRNETIVLVGHEAINRIVLMYALELPLSHYWRFRQDPCCARG